MGRRQHLARRGLLFLLLVGLTGSITFSDATTPVAAGGETASLGDFAEKALEKLPWDKHIIRANLGSRNPVAIEGFYVMERQLLVVTSAGRVYCLDRRSLEPRWVNTLRFPLAKPPAESASHYAFLMKDDRGSSWVTIVSKRSGSQGSRFPVRLPYSASTGLAVNQSMVFLGSLGRVGNNKTLESVNLISGRSGWGYRTSGMLWGTPSLDPAGDILVVAADDGVVTALPAAASAPRHANWARDLGTGVRGSTVVTPENVIAGNDDGLLYSLNLFSGKVAWLKGLDERIRSAPVVFGGFTTIKKSTGVEGAATVDVKRYEGLVFARNINGLHCFDLRSGADRFLDEAGGRPLCRQGKILVTIDGKRRMTFRDMSNGFKVTGGLNLTMCDLVPTNTRNGEIFAATADGTILAAIPK